MKQSFNQVRKTVHQGFGFRLIVLMMVLAFSASPAALSAGGLGDILNKVSQALDGLNSALTGAPMQTAPAPIVSGSGVTPASAPAAASSAKSGSIWDRLFGGVESSMEKTMGENGHKSLSEKPGFSRDRNELARLERVARRLVPTCERKDLTYRFSVLNTDEVNAFAVPGGYVYVTKGLLKSCQSDDELAAVVAHELGHVNRKHGVRQAEKAGLMAAVVALMGLNDDAKKAQGAAAIAAYFATLKFSRDDEFEADRKAVEYTSKAGYDPRGMITFFNKINKDSKLSSVTKYFSTHPPTNDRIKAVNKEIAKVQGKPANAPEALPASGYAQTGSTAGSAPSSGGTSQSANIPGIESIPGIEQIPAQASSRPAAQQVVTQAQLQTSYEKFTKAKDRYAKLVTDGAPIEQILAANKEYQAAQAEFIGLKNKAGSR